MTDDPLNLFGENATQADMLMLLLDSFPGQMEGVNVGIHPKARRPWAEALLKRGVRVHPELMEEFPIPGDHLEAGFLNPNKWVSREEYAKYAAGRPDAETTEGQLRSLLETINPGLAKKISSMTPEEKAAARVEQEPQMQDLFNRMHELGKQLFTPQPPAAQAEEEQ